ncbi:hypothetical protein PILCRDRAFT_90803 [Piloderma croceum F 1598]|uniref:Uncharacterized protein n=1 Tax=Piloderma croceum (strain F 1598) TaxID=765440 RepID=A0A0C3FDV2_PILCF|nr:hypothetical protein PILCRDRAFT_90803 [Piloderma croceum F 1598]
MRNSNASTVKVVSNDSTLSFVQLLASDLQRGLGRASLCHRVRHYYFTLKYDPVRWATIFPQLSDDATLRITASDVSIKHSSGEGQAVLTDSIIAISGDGNAHESFILRRNVRKNGNCCKTCKPYDRVVTAISIRATQLLGSNYMEGSGEDEIGSDGDWDEWICGRDLVKKVFPNDEVTCPWND